MSEKLISTQLTAYITKISHFHKFPNDFTQGRSTATAIHNFLENCSRGHLKNKINKT
jgi:hypothetical protein